MQCNRKEKFQKKKKDEIKYLFIDCKAKLYQPLLPPPNRPFLTSLFKVCVTQLAAFVILASDYFFFFFRVALEIPKPSTNPYDYLFFQSFSVGGVRGTWYSPHHGYRHMSEGYCRISRSQPYFEWGKPEVPTWFASISSNKLK